MILLVCAPISLLELYNNDMTAIIAIPFLGWCQAGTADGNQNLNNGAGWEAIILNRYKVGRNDLCPCGSGKKYKNCCLRLDEIAEPGLDMFQRYNHLLTEIKLKLDRQQGTAIKKIRRDARNKFLRFSSSKALPPDHETIFSDWLWFDRREDGYTPAEAYLKEHGGLLDKTWVDCLQALTKSYLSIYIPLQASDATLFLADLCTGANCQVMLREPWEMEEDLQNLLLLGRVLDIPQGSIFSGMVLVLKNDAGQKDFIRRNLDYFINLSGLAGLDLVKQYPEIIYGIFDHALNKTKLSLSDIRVVSLEPAEYQLKEILNPTLLTPLYNTSGWQWFQPCDCQGYAHIAIGAGKILVCTDLAEDLPLINTLLEKCNLQNIRNVSNLLQPPRPEDSHLWFTIMKDQETERWMHTEQRELDGKTPAEWLQTERGKEKLLTLLHSIITASQSDEEKELLVFMCERIS